jgi:hypothetical protein
VCGALFIILSYFPNDVLKDFIIPLVLVFFISRFLWRKYLKKKGLLRDASSGLMSLIFWGLIGVFYVYIQFAPISPQFVLYETEQPFILSEFDEYRTPKSTNSTDEKDSVSFKNPAKKGLLENALDGAIYAIKTEALACAFLVQQGKLETCTSSTIWSERAELDNNIETVEILVSDTEPETCAKSSCHVTLIQTTQTELLRFLNAQMDNEKSNEVPPTAEASLITEWDKVVMPLIISKPTSNTWRHIQIKSDDGSNVTWTGK